MRNKKKLHKLVPAVGLAVLAAEAQAQVLYEPFDYGNVANTNLSFSTSPTRYSTSGTYWATRGVSANTTVLRTSADNYGIPSYQGGANILPTSFGTSARSVTTTTAGGVEFATLGLGQYYNAPGDLYWSAVIKPNSIPSSTGGIMFAGILSFTLPKSTTASTRQL
jgi:hypothetical protein